jgi:hypothetical protein
VLTYNCVEGELLERGRGSNRRRIFAIKTGWTRLTIWILWQPSVLQHTEQGWQARPPWRRHPQRASGSIYSTSGDADFFVNFLKYRYSTFVIVSSGLAAPHFKSAEGAAAVPASGCTSDRLNPCPTAGGRLKRA